MKIQTIFLILTFISAITHLEADDLPTFSIVELSIRSNKIMEAKYLSTTNGIYTFCGHELNATQLYADTFEIQGIENLYNTRADGHYKYRVSFVDADAILIFVESRSGKKYNPTSSGYRLLKEDKIYMPVQHMNPGKYSFTPVSDTISWDILKKRITTISKRVSDVLQIETIDDGPVRNQKLFAWLDEHRSEFGQPCGLNDDCGWGTFEYTIFKRITEANIATDTWKASQYFRDILYPNEQERKGNVGLLYDYGRNSFSTYQDIDYLVSTAVDESISMIDRKQALLYLGTACRKVYEDNIPLPSDEILTFQRAKQKEIRDKIIPLLSIADFKKLAFHVVSALSNPGDRNLDHRLDLEVLPLLKKMYLSEPPSEYKVKLTNFIIHNSSQEEWKELTGNDYNVFVDLNVVAFDTASHTLKIGIYYTYGKEPITEHPRLTLEALTDGSQYHKEYTTNMTFPFKSLGYMSQWQYLEANISDIPPGIYNVYITGSIGTNNDGVWKSAYATFELK